MIRNLGIEILGPESEEGLSLLQGEEAHSGEEGDTKTPKGEQDEEGMVILTPEELEEDGGGGIPSVKSEVSGKSKTSDILAFAKDLFEEGLIDLEDDETLEDFTKKDLMSRINDAIDEKNKEYQKEYTKKFTGAKKKFLEIEGSFEDEKEAMVIANDMNILENVTNEDIESNPQLAEWVITRTLAYRGADNKEIQERLEELKDLDKISTYAKEYAPKLKGNLEREVIKNQEQVKEAEEAALKRQEDYYTDMIDMIDSSDEWLPGLEVTKRMKTSWKKGMTEVVFTDPNGRQYNEVGHKQYKHPKEFNLTLEFLNSIGLMNFDQKGRYKPDLKVISKLMGKEIRRDIDKLVSKEQKIGRPASSTGEQEEGSADRLEFFQKMLEAQK
jgi:hypothetical protein